MSWLDRARAKAHEAMSKLPGKAGELATKANEALGRPLADEHELADRRAFAAGKDGAVVTAAPVVATAGSKEAAPVIVYHMDKTRRDAQQARRDPRGRGHPAPGLEHSGGSGRAVCGAPR
jgi:hypothetical protein